MLPTLPMALALRYLQHLSRCANPNGASLRKVNDFIGLVLPDGHERTSGIAVVVQMVPSALAGRETAVVAFLQYVRMVPKIERRRAFEDKDVLLFLQMVVKLIRIFAGPKFIDANSYMRAPPAYLPSRLNRSLPGSCSHGMSSMLNGSKLPCPFLVVVSFAMMETSGSWNIASRFAGIPRSLF